MVQQNLAGVLRLQGKLGEARASAEEALQAAREIDDKNGIMLSLDTLARICLDQGEVTCASESYQEQIDLAERLENRKMLTLGLPGQGWLLLHQGELGRARARMSEGLAMLEELGEPIVAIQEQLRFCRLLVEEGNPQEAEQLARRLSSEILRLEAPQLAVGADRELARALLAQGRIAQAQAVIRRALEPETPGEDLLAELELEILAALGAAASGRYEQASGQLRLCQENARTIGHLPLVFMATLALAEVELAGGEAAQGHQHLVRVEQEASKLGLLLFSGKAARLRSQSANSGTPSRVSPTPPGWS
jgi:ATP/maltotriose-dependent transcriptional regulator MalT